MLKNYLAQDGLVRRVLTLDELETRIEDGRPVEMMMGQSYDDGQPIDLLKYSLFMMNLKDLLKPSGVDVNINMLLADHFMTDFNKEMSREEAINLGGLRRDFLERVNVAYSGDIRLLFSSVLSQSERYQQTLDQLRRAGVEDPVFKETLLQSVPEKYRENPDALNYPFEEVACIASLDTDIKIGPSYELFYDGPARDAAPMVGFNRYIAVHLTNSQLLGEVSELDEKTRAQIESFGVLPYQFRSKGLSDNRINLGDYDSETVEELIRTTGVDGLVDLLVISELAQQRVEEKVESGFFSLGGGEGMSLDSLRDLASLRFHEYIAKPLGYE